MKLTMSESVKVEKLMEMLYHIDEHTELLRGILLSALETAVENYVISLRGDDEQEDDDASV